MSENVCRKNGEGRAPDPATPALAIALGASYRRHFIPSGYAASSVSLGTRYYVGGNKVDLAIDPRIEPVFPLFYSHCERYPVGRVFVRNNGLAAIQDVRASLFVREYMEVPKPSAEWIVVLGRGKEASIALNALFKHDIFSVTTATKVAGVVQVSYRYFGAERTTSLPVSIVVNARNAMTWDDTDKVAGFVTPKDDRVRDFALRYATDARSRGGAAVNATFRVAVALFEALKEHGMGYVTDPTTSFAETSANGAVVDYLQFPVESLAYKAGDCDDLAILYAALLEATGISTAFVTTPGHISVAFDLGMDVWSARQLFATPQDLIPQGTRAWIPVEVTAVRDGFLRAWRLGAEEWQAASARGNAGFSPMEKAWVLYPPGFTGQIVKGTYTTPDPARVAAAFGAEMAQLAARELAPRETQLLQEISAGQGDTTSLRGRLGVLYARFGELDKARQQFELAVASAEVPSALVNLGNVAYLEGKYLTALGYYGRAVRAMPQSPRGLLGLARTGHELGNGNVVKDALARLAEVDQSLAARHQYLAVVGGERLATSTDEEPSR